MRFKWDKKYLYWGTTALVVILISMIAYSLFFGSSNIGSFFSMLLTAFSPVILGFALAYIFNPLLKLIEIPAFEKWGLIIFANSEYKERKAKTFSRAITLLLTIVVILAALGLLLWLIIPRLYESVIDMISKLPTYYASIRNFLQNTFSGNENIKSFALNTFDSLSTKFQTWLSNDLLNSLTEYVETVFSGIFGVVKSVFNGVVGFIIAIYVLAEKDKFSAQSKKLLYSTMSTKRATKTINDVKKVDKIFTGFISGKIIDSVIVGFLTYIVLTIVDMPYKELVSVFIGVTNVIPFFGPFIGAIPSAFLIFMVSPFDCLIFLIIILIIQQIDGNIFAPKILGDSIGLSGFWVLVSLLVFGSIFGFVGMLVGVPTFAVIYAIIKEFVYKKLRKKNITEDTVDFKQIDYIDPETNEPVMKLTRKERAALKEAERQKKKEEKERKKQEREARKEANNKNK